MSVEVRSAGHQADAHEHAVGAAVDGAERAEHGGGVSEKRARSREGVGRMLAAAHTHALPLPARRTEAATADAVFDRVYLANAERLAALGRVLTGDVEAGRDLAHEVFMELLERLRQDPAFLREPAWGYLRHALVCTARNRHRRLKLEARRMVLFWQPRRGDDIERDATTFELVNALSELPVRMRQCAVLAFLEDMTYADIARVMGTSISTVDNQLRRARRRLGERLALIDDDGASALVRDGGA